jgi:hypothetical protein
MDKIETLYHSFVEDICKVFPEYKDRLDDNDNLSEKLQRFLKHLKKHMEPISERDPLFFQDDPILLDNISFKMMWKSNISVATKKTIWKYLQTFCVLMITMESEEKINDVIQQIEDGQKAKASKGTLTKMKLLKKLNASIDENTLPDEPEKNEMEEMGKMFENTGIGKIAKEITDDLNIEEMMKGGKGIESLMNPNTMSKLFQSISTKMGSLEGTMNTDNLVSEASNICETMKGNSMFESLMGMQQSMMTGNNTENKEHSYKDTSHNSNQTRERLKKKLEEKKSNESQDLNDVD